ncbi:MAG: hypothetical protein ACR2GR_09380 [Rhodothermales bacterium]
MSTLFPSLPDQARLWVYAADQPLGETQQARLLEKLDAFFSQWASHGRPVEGTATIQDDRFLLLSGLVRGGEISGCGMDASVHAVEETGAALGISWLSPLSVFFRDADGIVQSLPRSAFRKLVRAGTVTTETSVFDLSITTLADVRQGRFERPAGETWHALVFKIPQPIA